MSDNAAFILFAFLVIMFFFGGWEALTDGIATIVKALRKSPKPSNQGPQTWEEQERDITAGRTRKNESESHPESRET